MVETRTSVEPVPPSCAWSGRRLPSLPGSRLHGGLGRFDAPRPSVGTAARAAFAPETRAGISKPGAPAPMPSSPRPSARVGTDGSTGASRSGVLSPIRPAFQPTPQQQQRRHDRQVPPAGLDQEASLADRHRGSRADSEQPGFNIADLAAVPGCGQFCQSCPPPPARRRHPLPLVGADDALPGRRLLVGVVITAGRADPDWHAVLPAFSGWPRRGRHRGGGWRCRTPSPRSRR